MNEKAPRIEFGADGCARIRGELTFATTPGLYQRMEQQRERDGEVRTIDLSEVTGADSSGLALLLQWRATHRPDDGEFRIVRAPANLLRLARLCEADEMLSISGRESAS